MDDESVELVKAVAAGGAEGFLRTVAAPLVQAGELVADFVRRRRVAVQVKTIVMAKQLLDEAKIPPHAVSLRVLVPLLEHAGLADDVDDDVPGAADAEAMTARWAALLANAAAGDAGAAVPAAFPEILAELEAIEAAALDWLITQPPGTQLDVLLEQLGYKVGDDWHRFNAYVDNLTRLGLCEVAPRPRWFAHDEIAAYRAEKPVDARVRLTDLGANLILACSPPTGAQTGAHRT